MIALNSASSSPNDVSIRQATCGIWDRMSRHTVTPSPSGSRTSRTATSGRSAGMRASADWAVPASPTTMMSGSASSRSLTPRRTISWSSSRNTLMVPVSTVVFIVGSLLTVQWRALDPARGLSDSVHYDDGASGVMGDLVRYRANQQRREAAGTARPDHDELGVARGVDQRFGRESGEDLHRDRRGLRPGDVAG